MTSHVEAQPEVVMVEPHNVFTGLTDFTPQWSSTDPFCSDATFEPDSVSDDSIPQVMLIAISWTDLYPQEFVNPRAYGRQLLVAQLSPVRGH